MVKDALDKVLSNKGIKKDDLAAYIKNVGDVIRNLKIDANSSSDAIANLRKLLVSLKDETNVEKLEQGYANLRNTT
jgi:uncharacterized protein YdcH (DUF465 family)